MAAQGFYHERCICPSASQTEDSAALTPVFPSSCEDEGRSRWEQSALAISRARSISCRCAIYYEDTDLSGVVYHANYLRYMERGRTEFFRLAGISKMATWTARSRPPGRSAMRRSNSSRPARLDDPVRSTRS